MESITNNSLQVKITYKQILAIALPIAASIVVPQLNFITNNIFLGHLSKEALAIAGITGVYYLIFAVIGSGLNNGLQSLIARRAGENKMSDIGNLFNQGVFIALVLSLVFVVHGFKLWRKYSDEQARQTFKFSLVHLSVLFAAMLIDHYLF